ncbi:hypothetical protein OAA06_01020 [bacterium]|nr:hypothetical protein [bacterium]
MKIKVVITIVYAIVMLGCNKESVDNGFTGITSTNESGMIIDADQDDWNFNDTWNQTEQDLFHESYEEMCVFETISNGMMSRPNNVIAFPNPCHNFFL